VPILRLGGALLVGFVLGCLIYGCSGPRAVRAASLKPDIVRLSDYKGKVVLLDFWATWCGPCKIEIPWFMDFERQHKDEGLAVLGVAMDDDGWDAVKPFVNEIGINYRIMIGNDSTAESYGGIEALPTTFLIDRDGKIAAVHVGLTSKGEIENGIEQLLQKPANAPGGAGNVSLPAQLVGAN